MQQTDSAALTLAGGAALPSHSLGASVTGSVTSFLSDDAIFVVALLGFLLLLGALKWGAISFGSRYGGMGLSVAFIVLGLFLVWAGVNDRDSTLVDAGFIIALLAGVFFVLELFVGRHQLTGGRSRNSSD